MIEVAVAVVGDLPVGPIKVLAPNDVGVIEGEVVEDGVVTGQEGVDIDGGAGLERDPDHARALGRGELGEAEAGLVELAEIALVEDSDELALQVVRPGVVVAAKDLGLAGLGLRDHEVAAVAAHVDEGAGLAILGARDEDGDTGYLHRLVGAGLSQLGGEGECEGQAPEDAVDLGLPALGVVVERGGDLVDLVGEVDAVVLEVLHLAAGHLHQLLSGHRHTPTAPLARSSSGNPIRITLGEVMCPSG